MRQNVTMLKLWAPVDEKFNLEISSCSNFEDFQARRAKYPFSVVSRARKPELVHTLNASGTALPRLIIAILETYQQEDGSIRIPEAIVPYMGGVETIDLT